MRRAVTAATAAAIGGFHLWLSSRVPGPSLLWDGTAYLSMARWLAGEATPYLGDLGHYGIGYPILLVPAVWATSSIEGLFGGVRILNAAAAASALPALVILGRRVGGLPWTVAVPAAAAGLLLPSVAVQAGFEWPESVLVTAIAWTAVAALRFAERPAAGRAAVLAAAAAGSYLVHQRALALVVATGVVLLVAGRPGRAGVALLVVLTVAATLLHQWAADALWAPGSPSQLSSGVETATSPATWPDAARRGAGQLWYALVATAALAPLAVVWLVRRRQVWVLLAFGATLGIAVLKLAGRPRPDHLVYGRYLDGWLPILVVLGVAALLALPRRRAAAVAAVGIVSMVALAVVVVATAGSGAFDGVYMPLNVLGVLPFRSGSGIDVAEMTIAGAAAACLVAGLGLPRRVPALYGAGLAGCAALASIVVAGDRNLTTFAASANSEYVLAGILDDVDPDAPVAIDLATFDPRAAGRYGLVDRDRRFTRYQGDAEPPPHDLVISGKDPASPPAPGARVVFPEPARVPTLWVLPGPLQDRLASRGFLVAASPDPPARFRVGTVELTGVRDGRVVVRVAKGPGGAPWLAPSSLPGGHGEVEVAVTVAGRTSVAPLPTTLLPGQAVTVAVDVGDVAPGEHRVLARLRGASQPLAGMPKTVGSLRFA